MLSNRMAAIASKPATTSANVYVTTRGGVFPPKPKNVPQKSFSDCLPFRQLSDRRIDVQPNQLAFFVIVGATAPVIPLAAGSVQNLRGRCGVLQIAPGPAGPMVEFRRARRQRFLILSGRA